MKFLIDGYNLLHQSPVMERGSGPKWLEQQRDKLVRTLAELLPEEDRLHTVVVFDAHSGKSPSTMDRSYQGIAVRYAHHHADADDLIESLIDQHENPQSLLVVSSDRRLQRSARGRRARWIDSRAWFDHLRLDHDGRTRSQADQQKGIDPEALKNAEHDVQEVERWLRELGFASPDSPVSEDDLGKNGRRSRGS